MKNLFLLTSAAATSTMLFALSACTTQEPTVPKPPAPAPAVKAEAKAETTTRETETLVSDSWVTSKVKDDKRELRTLHRSRTPAEACARGAGGEPLVEFVVRPIRSLSPER